MSEELLLNDRRGISFGGGSLDHFSLWVQKVARAGIRTMDLPIPHLKHCPLGYPALLFAMLQSFLFQQQTFTPEWEQ